MSEPDTPLLWVIRDEIGLTGTKFGCGAKLRRLHGAPGRSANPLVLGAEISMKDGAPVVHKVTVVADPGAMVNPDTDRSAFSRAAA